MTWGKRRAIIIVVLIFVVICIFWAISSVGRAPRVMANSVLVVDASGVIEEQRPPDFASAFTNEKIPVLHDYLDGLDTARNDPKIIGLVVRIGPLETGWAKLEEIRNHLLAFRKSGKPNICYLGYDGIGNPEYYLASACSQVWLLPTAPVSIHGMMAQAVFVRGTLDKLKIVPEFYHIAEFKTATNMFTEKKFTPAHKEEVETLMRSIYSQYISDASQSRNIPRAKFEELVNQAPLSSSEALAGKLVDRLAYWDQVQDSFKSHKDGWNPVSLRRYRANASEGFGGERIALITATGLIVSGASQETPTGGSIMGGDSVAAELRRARTDSSIKAIVLRIDSGGGSAVASEVIRREVQLAKGIKPVVVSMSDVAASGGYWIAMDANKIVADPNTITASIGVLTGKFNISGLFGMLGISTDSVATSDNASMFSSQQNFTPTQRDNIQKSLNETYANFTKGVAAGRHMQVEAVDKIGKGRVWSGAQAKDLGLVDELGGLDRSLEIAKQLAHIPASSSIHIVRLPEEKNFFQTLLERQTEPVSGALSGTRSADVLLRHLVHTMEPVQARIPFDLIIR
jgi:protease IV